MGTLSRSPGAGLLLLLVLLGVASCKTDRKSEVEVVKDAGVAETTTKPQAKIEEAQPPAKPDAGQLPVKTETVPTTPTATASDAGQPAAETKTKTVSKKRKALPKVFSLCLECGCCGQSQEHSKCVTPKEMRKLLAKKKKSQTPARQRLCSAAGCSDVGATIYRLCTAAK